MCLHTLACIGGWLNRGAHLMVGSWWQEPRHAPFLLKRRHFLLYRMEHFSMWPFWYIWFYISHTHQHYPPESPQCQRPAINIEAHTLLLPSTTHTHTHRNLYAWAELHLYMMLWENSSRCQELPLEYTFNTGPIGSWSVGTDSTAQCFFYVNLTVTPHV